MILTVGTFTTINLTKLHCLRGRAHLALRCHCCFPSRRTFFVEIDSYAISPPSVVEACLGAAAINTSVAATMAPDLSIESACSTIADTQRTAAALTVSTCSSTAFSNDIAYDDVFDSDAAKYLPGVRRPVKERDGGDDGPYSRMLNQSYYLATSQEEFLPQGVPVGNKPDSFDSQAPPTRQPPPTRFKVRFRFLSENEKSGKFSVVILLEAV